MLSSSTKTPEAIALEAKETEYLRHVYFDKPIVIKMDGKKSLGVVLKPEKYE